MSLGLAVDRAVAAGEGRFTHRFGIGGVGVAGEGQILGRGAEFHGNANLVDQVTGHRADDMRAKNTVGFLVGQQLDEAVTGEIGLGAAIAHEGELTHLVGAARLLELCLGLADAGDLGVGVDHAGDDAIVHMAMFAGDHLGGGHAFILGLVGEHGAVNGIADGVDAVDIGAPLVIGFDLATLGHLDAEGIEAKAIGEGFAAGGDQNGIGVEGVLAVVLAELVVVLGLGFHRLDRLHGGAHDEFKALFLQQFLELLLYLAVHAGGNVIQEFNNRHLRAQARIDRAHFQPDDARADDHHFLGDFRQFQCARGGDDGFLVHLDTRQRGGFGACGDDDVLGLVGLVTHLDLALFGDRAPALDPVYLVLFEQEFDALGVLADDVILVGEHLFPVHGRRFALEAHLGEVVFGLVQLVGGVQQRLGGDAADVEAGAAKGFSALDAGGFQAELRAADGGDIAAGAGADDDDVIVCHGSVSFDFSTSVSRRYYVGIGSVLFRGAALSPAAVF